MFFLIIYFFHNIFIFIILKQLIHNHLHSHSLDQSGRFKVGSKLFYLKNTYLYVFIFEAIFLTDGLFCHAFHDNCCGLFKELCIEHSSNSYRVDFDEL